MPWGGSGPSSDSRRLEYILVLKLAQVLKLAPDIYIYIFFMYKRTATQAGLIVIKMKLNAFSVTNGTMIEDVTISKQHKFILRRTSDRATGNNGNNNSFATLGGGITSVSKLFKINDSSRWLHWTRYNRNLASKTVLQKTTGYIVATLVS